MIPRSNGPYARPYIEHFNVDSVYKNIGYTVTTDTNELSDEDITYLTESEIEMYVSRGDSAFNVDIHEDLFDEDYADAILAELAN